MEGLYFLFGFMCLEFIYAVKGFIVLMRSAVELNSIKKIPNYGVRLCNMQVNKRESFPMMIIVIIACIAAANWILKYKAELDDVFEICFLVMVICIPTTLLIRGVLICWIGELSFLVPRGVVSVDNIYDKKYLFTIEKEVADTGKGYMYINIYKKDNPIARRYKILESEEKAIEMVKRFNGE